MKDQDVIAAIRSGSKDYIKGFYLDNKVGFIHFLQSKTSIEPDSLEDIYQDAMIVLIENIQRGKLDDLKSSLKTYLFSIGKYMAFRKNKLILVQDDALLNELWIYEDDQEDDEEEKWIALIQSKINELSEACQKVLKWIYYEGKKPDAILKLDNYANKDVIKSQKSRCLAYLKRLVYESTSKGNRT